ILHSLRRSQAVSVAGTEIWPVLRSEARVFLSSFAYLTELLLYARLRSVFEAFEVKCVVYPIEHHAWERVMLRTGRARPSPRPAFAGYQHSYVSEMHLFYFPPVESERLSLMPDVVLASARRYAALLAGHPGYREVPVIYAGGLRFDFAGSASGHDPADVRWRLGV